MSTLIVFTVGIVAAVVPYTFGYQLKANLNDVINWLNHPERYAQFHSNNNDQTNLNYDKRLQTFLDKASKILQNSDRNDLNYNNEKQLGSKYKNQPFKTRNGVSEANSIEIPNQYLPVKASWLKSLPMKRKPNYQLVRGTDANNLYEDARNNDLSDYSKIYLVLDPEADLEKTDLRDIGNLVYSMLSKHSINNKPSGKDRPERLRYKGFVLKDNRRRIKESNEMFAQKDSIEREHKQKRGRSEYTGVRGRTGVPYVRHRGDVYERE